MFVVKDVKWVVGGTVYLPLLDEDATLGVYIMAEVSQTKQIFTKDDTFWVQVPDLEVEVSCCFTILSFCQ